MKLLKSNIQVLAALLSLFMVINVMGQEDETDFQTWMDFRTIYDVNEKWTYDGNYGMRGVISGEDWRKYYIHPSVIYYHKINLRIRGGVRFIFTEEYTTVNSFEIRPWQGISLNWPQTSYFTINNYFRLEERFTFYSSEISSDFALRLRYRIQAKTPTLTIKAINQRIYLLANYEAFINVGNAVTEKYINRRRISFAMGVYITNAWWFELHYALQGSRRNSDDGIKTNEQIFRFRLRWKIN